jgi:hypothetical protein
MERDAGSGSVLPGWSPDGVENPEDEDLRYLVVDEIVDGSVGLALSPWPGLDDQGRLRFGRQPARLLGADRGQFEAFLAEHRRPVEQARRTLRIGDAFAVLVIPASLEDVTAELDEPVRMQPLLPPDRWLRPPVVDVTGAARDAAKTAFFAAVAPTLEPEQAAEFHELEV